MYVCHIIIIGVLTETFTGMKWRPLDHDGGAHVIFAHYVMMMMNGDHNDDEDNIDGGHDCGRRSEK